MISYSTASGRKTSSSQIVARTSGFCGIDANPPDTGFTDILVYDSEDSNVAGKLILAEIHLDAGHTSVNHEYLTPVIANKGIYVQFTNTGGGSGSGYVVRFILC